MDPRDISVEHKEEVFRVQKLLAEGGVEVLHSFYFDLLLYGLWTPGSLNIHCYVCADFDGDREWMEWNPGGTPRDGECSILCCFLCSFTMPFPCGDWRSEDLLKTLRWIADHGEDWFETLVEMTGD